MTLELDISVAHDRWQAADPGDLAQRAAAAVDDLQPEGYRPGIVGLLFTDNDTMRGLNDQWRDKDKPTNVLSFPAEDMPEIAGIPAPVGDIALGYEICAAEAAEKQISVQNHAMHLIVHGLLHLFGYDHIEDDEARLMESLETRLLSILGVPDPYGDGGSADDGECDA